MLFFKFLWLEFRFKSFLELHMHFKGFVCLRMRKLHAECQIPADAHDWCQFVFSFNVPKFIPKYWTTKTLLQFLGWSVRTLAQYTMYCVCWNRAAQTFYTPGIYAEGYIVFVFPFIRTYVCLFVRFFVRLWLRPVRRITSKFFVKVSQVEYIAATTNQKAFIFGP